MRGTLPTQSVFAQHHASSERPISRLKPLASHAEKADFQPDQRQTIERVWRQRSSRRRRCSGSGGECTTCGSTEHDAEHCEIYPRKRANLSWHTANIEDAEQANEVSLPHGIGVTVCVGRRLSRQGSSGVLALV